MFRIKTMNKIAQVGLNQFPADYQVGDSVEGEEGILVRSAKLHDYPFPDTLWGIARAGAGTNNIPVAECAQKGIVVFNTPGANANGVKELVLAALLALRLDRHVHVVKDVAELYRVSDYVTIHVPYTPDTRHTINADAIAQMKDGVRIVNLARGELVDDEAMMAALERGKVARYVTDFPNNTITLAPNVVPIPHLGASTPESEDNCAIMAAQQLRDFLENGNIKNSVNFPNVEMERSGVQRLCIIHRNIPAMLANITAQLSGDGVNVENMTNKSRGDFAYTLVDVGSQVEESVIDDIRAIDGIIRVRVIS